MKLVLFCLLPLLPAAAHACTADEMNGDSSQITIYTDFAHSPAAAVIPHMKAELDNIMAPLSLRFDWCSLSEADGRHAVYELVVVRFRGACQVDTLPTPAKSGPLGWTHVAGGRMLPFTDVDCDRIREIMTLPLAVAAPVQRPQLLGRAMGRVLAHELYHFLTNTARHGTGGITKRAYNAADLTTAHLWFDPADLNLLRESTLHTEIRDVARASP
ncbi:MAG: hypothetical protein ABSH50_09630 [Bryobacteraceae bacterium]|jgi:hypothetical protein